MSYWNHCSSLFVGTSINSGMAKQHRTWVLLNSRRSESSPIAGQKEETYKFRSIHKDLLSTRVEKA